MLSLIKSCLRGIFIGIIFLVAGISYLLDGFFDSIEESFGKKGE